MRHKTRKVTSILLALMMVFTLLPVTAMAALVTYPLFVQGVRVNAINRDDVLDDGGSVKFVPGTPAEKPRLILNNASIDVAGDGEYGENFGIWWTDNNDLILELKGTNSINATNGGAYCVGLRAPAQTTVIGTGSLVVDMNAPPSAFPQESSTAISVNSLMVHSRLTAVGGNSTMGSTGVYAQFVGVYGGSLTAIGSSGDISYGLCGIVYVDGGVLEAMGHTGAFDNDPDYASGTEEYVITVSSAPSAQGAVPWDGESSLWVGEDNDGFYSYVKIAPASAAGPVITSQPDYCSVAVGATASFTVAASGTGLTYQWQYLAPGGSWKNSGASSARTARLSFTAAAAQNGYEYRCVVTDATGASATSQIAGLIVTSPLTITTQPRSATVAAGATATFTVKATGGAASAAAGLFYQWQYQAPGGSWKNSGASSARTATLSFTATAAQNGYKYRCVVTDPTGASVTSNAATLTVGSSAGVTITTQPKSTTVAAGAKATFTVKASGTGLTYQWQYLAPGGAWKNSGASAARTATLSFNATAAQNGYKYRCVVKNAAGASVTSSAATLTVSAGVTITTQPKSVTVAAGSKATFTVKASGSGLTYQWQYLAPGGSWKNSGASAAKTATLSFNATAAQNGYKYRCVVKDSSGKSVTSNVATLTVGSGSAAPSITTQPKNAKVTAGSKATFTVAASGTGLTYQWQYLAPGGSWKNSGASSARTATLSFTAAATHNGYKYRCIVTGGGQSVTSAAVTLTVG